MWKNKSMSSLHINQQEMFEILQGLVVITKFMAAYYTNVEDIYDSLYLENVNQVKEI